MADIYKVAGISIRNKKILLVHKKTLDLWISTGGKLDPGETELECLVREHREELGCEIKDIQKYLPFYGKSHDGKDNITISSYFCTINSHIRLNPKDNIDGYAWIGRNYEERGFKLAPMLTEQIIPMLITQGFL